MCVEYISDTQTYYIHSLASASTNFSVAAKLFGNSVSNPEAEVQDFRRKLQFAGVVYRDLAQLDRMTELAMAYRRDNGSPVLQSFLNVTREIAAQTHSQNTYFSAGPESS